MMGAGVTTVSSCAALEVVACHAQNKGSVDWRVALRQVLHGDTAGIDGIGGLVPVGIEPLVPERRNWQEHITAATMATIDRNVMAVLVCCCFFSFLVEERIDG